MLCYKDSFDQRVGLNLLLMKMFLLNWITFEFVHEKIASLDIEKTQNEMQYVNSPLLLFSLYYLLKLFGSGTDHKLDIFLLGKSLLFALSNASLFRWNHVSSVTRWRNKKLPKYLPIFAPKRRQSNFYFYVLFF